MAAPQSPASRLQWYWRTELWNAALLPVVALALFWPPGWLSLVALIPMSGLLVIGGLYWRAKLRRLQGDPQVLSGFLAVASRLQPVLAAATATAVIVVTVAWFGGLSFRGTGDRVVATIAAALAAAEYVNYYHRQLQHFDRAADWRRLLTGRGFRPSHLKRDLARWRGTNRATGVARSTGPPANG